MTHPDLVREWDFTKNGDVRPQQFMSGSQERVWWKCDVGHSWESQIKSRAGLGRGCPVCSNKTVLSGFNDLQTTNPSLASEWDFSRNGKRLPSEFLEGSNKKVWWTCAKEHSWEAAISSRSHGRGCPVCANKAVRIGVNDLSTTNPKLAEEWDFTKNEKLDINTISAGSHKKAWWLCPSGHSWEALISSRSLGSGCGICSNRSVQPGINDLATTNPELMKQWNFEKNKNINPKTLVAGSEQKVWWRCDQGHSWETNVFQRAGKRSAGCPYCSNSKTLPGFNDLATTNPELAKEWDDVKNGEFTADLFTRGSKKSLWWKCSFGHSWQASIGSRNSNKSGCPVCSNKAVLEGFNDLATTNPVLAAEWDYLKNMPLRPTQIVEGSKAKIFWLCQKGHSYQNTADARSRRGDGCPYCSGKSILAGFNDLQTTNPVLASEWDFEKNNPLRPSDVTSMSNKKVWWKCEFGHVWRTDPNHRSYGRGCPQCADSGYDASRSGLLYFISSQTHNARKIGIMNPNRKGDRLAHWVSSGWKVLAVFESSDGSVIRDTETAILRWIRKDLGLPVFLGKEEMGPAGGQTETFSIEGPSDLEVIASIQLELQRFAKSNFERTK